MDFYLADGINNKNEKSINIFEFVLIIFFTAYCILPSMSSKFSFIYILLLSVVYAIVIAIIDKEMTNPVLLYIALVLVLAISYYFLVSATGISIYSSNYGVKKFFSKFNEFFMMFFPVLLAARLIREANRKQMLILFLAAAVFFTVVIFKTLGEIINNPNVAREFDTFNETADENIANYYFIYAIPMIIALLTAYFFHIKNIIVKLILVGFIAFLFYFLIQAQYTLALLITVVGVYYESFKRIKDFRIKMIAFFITLIMIFFIPSVLKFVAEHAASEQISLRFSELYDFFVSGDSSGYNLNARLTLYWKSVQAFFHSPIVGNSSLNFDGHATLLVVPANIGLLGLIPLYFMLFKTNSYIKKLLGDKAYMFAPIFLMLILMGLTNPINTSTAISVATWLIAPVSINVLLKSEKTTSNDNEDKPIQDSTEINPTGEEI